jgi:hypothetical protein
LLRDELQLVYEMNMDRGVPSFFKAQVRVPLFGMCALIALLSWHSPRTTRTSISCEAQSFDYVIAISQLMGACLIRDLISQTSVALASR